MSKLVKFIKICRVGDGIWRCCTPDADVESPASYYAGLIMLNEFATYVEYEVCGLTYRIIRDDKKERKSYGL